MDDRKLTFIVVPHGDVETRSFRISYGRLKLLLGLGLVVLVLFVVVVSSWWYVAAQAARVVGLERDVHRLELERSRVAELARSLEQVEAQYRKVRQLLGADSSAHGQTQPILPPLERSPGGGAAAADPPGRGEAAESPRPGESGGPDPPKRKTNRTPATGSATHDRPPPL